MNEPAVSILLVTFNAPRHILRLFRSLRQTSGVAYEVVVVDNRSKAPTRWLLHLLSWRRAINILTLLDHNTLFAGGVNIALRVSSPGSRHLLLLNPDIEIRDPSWLRRLLDVHQRGATSLGFVAGGPWPRADGYCLLIDRDLFEGLSPEFHWWWGVTKLQADLLRAGHAVQAIRDHDDLITHAGGASGAPPRHAKGMETDDATIRAWFDGHHVEVVDRLEVPR
jgi:glycosyltransferase involved in cell wall biosynthesis